MPLPTRTFGIEIEAVGLTPEQAAEALVENDIEASSEDLSHYTCDSWKIVPDCSLREDTGETYYTFEAVSPILSGEKGISELRSVVSVLRSAGAVTNRSCGAHVHIDVFDLSAIEVANIVKRYARFESQIDSFMPAGRRGNSGEWAKSVINWADRIDFDNIDTVYDVIDLQGVRESKVNLECYNRQGTIEFRHHNGSLNADKLENWVTFLLQFVEACRNAPVLPTEVARDSDSITFRAPRALVSLGVDSLYRGIDIEVECFYNAQADMFQS